MLNHRDTEITEKTGEKEHYEPFIRLAEISDNECFNIAAFFFLCALCVSVVQ